MYRSTSIGPTLQVQRSGRDITKAYLQEIIGDVTAQNHRSYDNQITSEDHPTSVIMMMDLVMHISSMVVF